MNLEGKTLKVCSCNRTVALDAKALGAALKAGEPLTLHHQLCRKDAGAFQAALGCAGDWDPACRNTELTLQDDGTYAATFDIPAGTYEYKVAINLAWAENYGADGVKDGPNLVLELADDSTVTFVYDDTTHVVTATVE